MTLPSIDLKIAEKLKDEKYRKVFFIAEASAHIAKQLIDLRKRRGLNQKALARSAGTGQPAISRAERADYNNWSFNTLRRLAEAMDARIRVHIEAAEDVLWEYNSVVQQNDILGSVVSENEDDNSGQKEKSGWPTGSVNDSARNDNAFRRNDDSHLGKKERGISGY